MLYPERLMDDVVSMLVSLQQQAKSAQQQAAGEAGAAGSVQSIAAAARAQLAASAAGAAVAMRVDLPTPVDRKCLAKVPNCCFVTKAITHIMHIESALLVTVK